MSSRFESLVKILACLACLCALSAAARKEAPSEETVIRELDRKWVEGIAAKDLDSTVAHYADDAAFLAPNASVSTGKVAIRAAWEGLLKSPGLSLTFGPTTIRVARAGDMAYEIGTYKIGMDAPGGRAEDEGKYVYVWTRVGGDWKVAADIFNSSRSPIAPEVAH
jgi:uncharacterized protein (TIGR02246 family)